ncbi:MAG: class I tRNA ligase family protein, partial [Actinobacteria bacterium]|nr:class I tRNA ligase family protein [Actinomycetota bacterium]
VDASGSGTAADKADAFDTLYTVLVTLSKVIAPLLPMLAEEIHTGLTGERSVHLADWPDPTALPADPDLVRAMDEVRAACSTDLGVREDHKLRSRLPLRSLAVAGARAEALGPFADLIAQELNVKAVPTSADRTAYGTEVVRPNPRALGPRLGKDVQAVIKAAKAGEWSRAEDGSVLVGGHALHDGEYELVLQAADDVAAAPVRYVDPEGRTIDTGLVVALDTTVTPELHAEGVARDLVRLVQQARKDAGLEVTDRISLALHLPAEQAAMVEAHRRHLADSVLATSVDLVEEPQASEATLDGVGISFAVARA